MVVETVVNDKTFLNSLNISQRMFHLSTAAASNFVHNVFTYLGLNEAPSSETGSSKSFVIELDPS